MVLALVVRGERPDDVVAFMFGGQVGCGCGVVHGLLF